MSTNVLRTRGGTSRSSGAESGGGWWVVRDERAVRIDTKAVTTAELLADRDAVREAAASGERGTPVADLVALPPVTTPCRVVAQMVNYRSHARDSGFTGDIPPTFFRKASGSVSGPHDAIVRPAHVNFLDYEVELGLVMGATLPVGTVVEEQDLASYVAGLVLTNDVSARDVQLTKTQFYESKSYPTFTPTGPYLALLEPEDFDRLIDLRLRLSVNGVPRQDRTPGGQDRGAAFRRAVVGAACRIPGVTAAVSRDLSPALTAGPLVRRRPRLTGRSLAGTFCPQPWVRHDGRRVRLDDVLGDSFAVLTAVPPTARMTAVAMALGAPTIHVDDLGPDGTLAAWLARGRADAVLLRPDRVVMDTVPAGAGDFTDTAAWASLLHTSGRPDHRPVPPPRSATP